MVQQILILKLLADMKQPVQSIGELESRLKTLKTQLKNTPDEGTSGFNDLAKSISTRLNVDLDTAKDTIREFNREATKEVQKGTDKLKEYRKTLRTIEPAANSINALRQTVRSLAKEVDNLDRNTEEFTNKNDELRRLNQELINIEKTTKRGGRNVGNYETAFKGLGRTFATIGASVGIGIGLNEIGNSVKSSISLFAEYNQQVALLRSISRSSKAEIKPLEEEIRRLGSTTQFTARQSAEAATILARSGQNNQQIIKTLEPTLRGAIATGESIEAIANTTAKALRTLNIPVEEAGTFVSQLTQTLNTSNNQLSDYTEAFKEFAPTARSLKIPLEDVNATIGLLGDNGLQGTVATTSLRSSLVRLADDSKRYAKAAAELGVTVFDQNGQFVGMADLLENLETAFEGYNDKQRQAAISQIFGVRSLNQVNALLNTQKEFLIENETVTLSGADAFRQYSGEVLNATNAAKEASDIVGDTLSQDILKLKSALQEAAIQFGETSEGGLREFIQFITRSIPVLAEQSGRILKVAAVMTLFLATLKASKEGTILWTIATKAQETALKLMTRQITITEAITKIFNKTLKLNPFGLIITAIAALVFAFSELYQNSERFRGFIDSIVGNIKKFFNESKVVKQITDGIAQGFEFIGKVAQGLLSAFAGITLGIIDFVKESKLVNAIVQLMIRRVQGLVNFLTPALRLFLNITNAVVDYAKQSALLNAVFKSISVALSTVAQGFVEFVNLTENSSAFIAGLRAGIRETLLSIERFGERILITAQIASKQIEKLNPFGKTTAQLDEEINKLRQRRVELKNAGQSFGEAFNEAYNEELKNTFEGVNRGGALVREVKVKTEFEGVVPTGDDDDDGTTTTTTGDSTKEITRLQALQNEQRKLADEIKNKIVAGEPYEEQLKRFNELTKQLTAVNDEFNKSTKTTTDEAKSQANSINDFTTRINELKKEYNNLSLDSENYSETLAKVNALEEERERLLQLQKTTTSEYSEQLRELQTQLAGSSIQNQEIVLTETAITDITNISGLDQDGAEKIKAIQEKLNEDIRQLKLQSLRDQVILNNEEVENLQEQLNEELRNEELNEEQKLALRRFYEKQILQIQSDNLGLARQLLDEEYSQIVSNEQRKRQEYQKTQEIRKQIFDSALQVASELNSGINEIITNRREQQLEADQEALNNEEEKAIKSAEIFGATEEQKQDIRQKFEKEREKLEKEAAEKRKRQAIIESLINTALAVTKALASAAPPINFILAGTAAALGAIQTAVISSQKFALGGLFDQKVRSDSKFGRGAYLKTGRYHSQGGMPIINPHTGRKVAEIEKHEGIVNKRSMLSRDVLQASGTPAEIVEAMNTYKGFGSSYGIGNRSGYRKLSVLKARKTRESYGLGKQYRVNRIPKYEEGAIFGSDISNAMIVSSSDPEMKRLMIDQTEAIDQLRRSNQSALTELPTSSDDLRRIAQLILDQQNATT